MEAKFYEVETLELNYLGFKSPRYYGVEAQSEEAARQASFLQGREIVSVFEVSGRRYYDLTHPSF